MMNMKTIIKKLSLPAFFFAAVACADESLDPIRFNDLQKGSLLALRGEAFENLNETGCSNIFNKNSITGTEVFSFDADFLSEDPSSLQEVKVYGRIRTGARVELKTVAASAFAVPAGERYPRGTVSIPLSEILTKLNVTNPANLGLFDIVIESDLYLTDGSVVAAASIVNSGLFESGIFYPAQRLNYCSGTP
jgi:hypothetical protein